MNDILTGLKHVGVVVALFFIFILVALTEKNLAIIIGATATGAAIALIAAAFEHKKASIKVVIGWSVVGLLAGLGFAFFGV